MIRVLASAGYVGHVPWASGTAGALVGVVLCFLLRGVPGWVFAGIVAAGFFGGIPVVGRAEVIYGEPDSGRIVLDEVVGQMATLMFVPITPLNLAGGFFLFRFFDILKPYPIRAAERNWPGGVGVMGDDLLAAVYANLALHGVRWLL